MGAAPLLVDNLCHLKHIKLLLGISDFFKWQGYSCNPYQASVFHAEAWTLLCTSADILHSQKLVCLFFHAQSVAKKICLKAKVFITVNPSKGNSRIRVLHLEGKGWRNVPLVRNSAKLLRLGFTEQADPWRYKMNIRVLKKLQVGGVAQKGPQVSPP